MAFHNIDGGRNILPEISVEIDFANDPTSGSRTWVDVTNDVRQLSYARSGRDNELQQTSVGSLTMVLNNRPGNYSPANASGIYYPNVKRLRWLRVQARWAGVTYSRWRGLIESWDQDWPHMGKDDIVTVRASDALRVLNLTRIGEREYPEQQTGERVEAVCDDLGIVSSVATGVSTVIETAAGVESIETTALAHLQQVEETENGRLFADADGTIVFQDRHYRLTNASSLTSQGTIGDNAGEIPYREASLGYDDSNIWNKAIFSPAGGTAQTAEDTSSQTSYYERTLTRNLLTDDEIEALSGAQWAVKVYKDPQPTLPALTVFPMKATTHWPTVLGAENGDRFTFARRPSYATLTVAGFVERISEQIQVGRAWDVTFQMSAGGDQGFWVLGDPINGLLGQTTYVGY